MKGIGKSLLMLDNEHLVSLLIMSEAYTVKKNEFYFWIAV